MLSGRYTRKLKRVQQQGEAEIAAGSYITPNPDSQRVINSAM